MTTGYAVTVNGEVDIFTVGPHARAAQVNGLCVRYRYMVTAAASEMEIQRQWDNRTREDACDVQVRRVKVEVLVDA